MRWILVRAMTHVEFLILALVMLALPLLSTSTRAYALARYGFGRWFWITLPVAGIGGYLLSRAFPNLSEFPVLGLIFHFQWALLIAMCRLFVRAEGHEPRDSFMRGWDELPYNAPDRYFGFIATVVMFLIAAGLLYVSMLHFGQR